VLAAAWLIQIFVILEQRTIGKYQLKIKGAFCLQEIETLAKNRFSIDETQNFLIIYKP
jgi:hypothetical protein